ncbi:MAG TPA: hypothetical protein VNQ76_05905 [Planctomicrobium sp.]|nr:hypothetical protein [Planctomicrobium sp.]
MTGLATTSSLVEPVSPLRRDTTLLLNGLTDHCEVSLLMNRE